MIGTGLNVVMRRRGRRPAGPVSLSLFTLVMTGMAVFFFVFSFHIRAASAQSSYTQAHGVGREATVVSVQNIENHSHSQSYYTAVINAAFSPPVGGLSQTTVHVPHQVSYSSGETVYVLVDPQAPGYAELPGQPSVTGKDWWALLAGTAVCLLLAVFLGWQAIKKIRVRRLGY